MEKLYITRLLALFVGMGVGAGCHQEPDIPTSLVPPSCQLYRIANVNEDVRDTTSFVYDSFGHLTDRVYRQWNKGQLMSSQRQTSSYDADHYLITRIEQQTATGPATTSQRYDYAYQAGQVQQITISAYPQNQLTGYLTYTYENNAVKTYVESNNQKVPVRSYSFSAGKLTAYQQPGAVINATISNGKITTMQLRDSSYVNYEYDGEGQLTRETVQTESGNRIIKRMYTYDTAPYAGKTQLQLRGIPTLDLGGHSHVHNLISYTVQQTYKGQVVQQQTFTYRNAYNKARYLLGYARSDGARQSNVYANCL